MNCVYALKRLKLYLFGSDFDQYNLIPSYIVKLNDRGHELMLEIVSDEFVRLCVIFREGRKLISYTDSVTLPWMTPTPSAG